MRDRAAQVIAVAVSVIAGAAIGVLAGMAVLPAIALCLIYGAGAAFTFIPN